MSSTHAINCLFCFNSVQTYYFKSNQTHLAPSDIISCCSKYLRKEFIDSLKWTNDSSAAESLCQDCYNIAEKMNNMNIYLKKIIEDINELGTRLKIRISEERRNYDLSTEKLRWLTHSDISEVSDLLPNTIVSTEKNDTDSNYEVQKNIPTDPAYDQNIKSSSATTENINSVTDNFNESNASFFEALNSDVDSRCSEKDQLLPGKAVQVNNKGGPRKSFTERKEISNTDGTDLPLGKTGSQREELITSSEPQRHTKHGLDKDFKCDKCSKKFSTLATIKSHDCSKQTYECEVCSISFFTTAALKRHMLTHTGERPHECEICKKSFPLADTLKLHMRIHTGERPYTCEVCNKSFPASKNLKSHMLTHTGEKPHNCEVCKKSFSQRGTLKIHMRSHTGGKRYTCDICNKSYTAHKNLNIHMRTHTGEKPYKCETCGKCFVGSDNLTKHLTIHTEHRPFKCTLCEKAFRSNSALTRHLLTHQETSITHQKKNYMCDICSKSLSSLKCLKYHLLSHTESQNLLCKICGKMFKHEKALKLHEQYVHLPSDERPHQCNLCDKRFPTQTRLKMHIKTHSGIKPFLCEECGQSFFTATILANHIKAVHTNEAATCEICGNIYRNSVLLKIHKGRVHSGRTVTCKKCERVFNGNELLSRHLKKSGCARTIEQRQKERPFACGKCEMSFVTELKRRMHQIKHLPVNERRSMVCHICNSSYESLNILKTHYKGCHPESSCPIQKGIYPCKMCKSGFPILQYIKHLEKHTGENMTGCEHCKELFSSVCECTVHRLQVHPNQNSSFDCFKCKISLEDDRNLTEHYKSYHSKMRIFDKKRWNDEEQDLHNKMEYEAGMCEEIKSETENSEEFESSSSDEDDQSDNESESNGGTDSFQKEENSNAEIKVENDLFFSNTEIKIESSDV